MKLFKPHQIGNLQVKNRFVMPPMCMYSVHNNDGIATSFHLAHYTSRAIGQVGMIIVEATGVSPEGRITDFCLGLWNDEQKDAFIPIVNAVHEAGSKIAIQLNHAGRKCTATVPEIYGPSALAYDDVSVIPKEMSQKEIKRMIQDFTSAAKRADEAGFDAIELHLAHGYLLSSFMSPISNQRIDKYRDPSILYRELLDSIKTVWPSDKPIWIRVSATDYESKGYSTDYVAKMIQAILDDIALIHVSSGGITPTIPKAFPSYQVPFATDLKLKTQKEVIAVGLITTCEQAIDIIENERADFVAIGRALLRNPHFVLECYIKTGRNNLLPEAYKRGFR